MINYTSEWRNAPKQANKWLCWALMMHGRGPMITLPAYSCYAKILEAKKIWQRPRLL